jgi:hypothetical protein
VNRSKKHNNWKWLKGAKECEVGSCVRVSLLVRSPPNQMDDNLETTTARAIRMPQRHLFQTVSFHDAAQPSGGATGCGSGALPPPDFTGSVTCCCEWGFGFVPGVRLTTEDIARAARDVGVGAVDDISLSEVPRSRSPIFGRSFICSPQYFDGIR